MAFLGLIRHTNHTSITGEGYWKMRRVCEIVCDYRDVSDSLVDMIADLDEILESIPEEHREIAQIIFDYEEDCGVSYSVHYWREETEEDVRKREEAAEKNREAVERRERQELVRLQKKYGDSELLEMEAWASEE